MATRGTYLIDGFMCYNHYDNYPSGAATHLLNVVKHHNQLDLFSCIRGMADLQIGKSAFDGPAEFHYKIKDGTIECYRIGDDDKLHLYSKGVAHEWITEVLTREEQKQQKNGKTIFDEGETIDDITVISYRGNLYVKTDFIMRAQDRYADGVRFFEKGHTGNASSCFSDAFKMFNAVGIAADHLKKEYLATYSPAFTKAFNHLSTSYFDSVVDAV